MLTLVNCLVNTKKESDNILVFLHMQKCGGTTLQGIIETQYEYDERLRRIEEGLRDNVVVFKGHFAYGEEEKYLKPDIKRTYITMLREPVDRIMSSFYYVRRTEEMVLHKEFNKITFQEFLQNDSFYYKFRHTNMMARQLSGGDPDDLIGALRNLEKFDYVGIVEEFNKSLKLYAKGLGWNVKKYSNENVTEDRPKVTDLPRSTLELILEKNRNDTVLYKKAVELFWNKYNSLS